MKERHQEPSSDSTCLPPVESVSLSQKVSLTPLAVGKLCQTGRWLACPQVQHPLRRRSRNSWNGYRAMKRLSCSSTMTRQVVRRRRKRQASYHLASARSLTLQAITRMRQTPYQPVMRKQSERRSGTQDLTVQMVS